MKLAVLTLACLVVLAMPGNRASAATSSYLTGKITSGVNPARSVWVMAFDGAAEKGRSLTGDDGRYYIGNLEMKTYTIVVRKQVGGANLVSQKVIVSAKKVVNIKLP